MKAVILARVSTEEQLKEGQSIPAQSARAKEYCQRKELEIKSEYQFDESSTKDQREKFEKVIDEIRNSNEKIALIVETIDRLQRSFKESVILDELRKQDKVEIHFLRENLIISQNSNSADLLRWDMGVMFARSYVLQLSDNVKRTIEQKILSGIWYGKAHIGYINITKEDGKKWIIPDPQKKDLIIKMFELYANDGFSMEMLREWTKKNRLIYGITSKHGLSKGHIDKILKNPFYYGEMNAKGKLIPHKYESLISEELFNKVQEIKASHHKKSFKFAGKELLFRSLITCEECGCAISFDKKVKHYKKTNRTVSYIYGRCTNYFKKHKKAIWVTEEELIKQISKFLKGMTIPEKTLEYLTTEMNKSHEDKKAFHNNAVANLKAEHSKIQSRIEVLYEDRLDRRITPEIYDTKVQELKQKQVDILDQMKRHEQADKNYYIQMGRLLELASRAHELFTRSKVDQKRRLLQSLVSNLTLNGKKLSISLQEPYDLIFEHVSRSQWLPLVKDVRTCIYEENPYIFRKVA